MEKMLVKSGKELEGKGKAYARWYQEEETYLEEHPGQAPLLRFHSMEELDWLSLAFSTRLGGVSTGYLSSMNLGWDRGEARENVCENYKRICNTLGVDYRKLVLSDQVHGVQVVYANEGMCAGEDIEKKLKGVDGLVTDRPGLVLATSYADCVPLFLADPQKHIIASSHSGWKGTVRKIGQVTVKKMEEMGSKARDIIAVIGPSICQDCYEVSEDVAEEFRKNFPREAWKDIIEKGRAGREGEQKYQLDLWAANWYLLREAGLLPENIHLSGVCTCCNQHLLYSHRATDGKRGNLNGFLSIR